MTLTSPDTTGPHAGAGLRSAPLGPGSITWKWHGDRRGLLFLWRTGTMQNMHPAVNSALQQQSNFFANPWDRLFRSIPPIMGTVYDVDGAATGVQVRDFHRPIKGEDDGHGRRWSALNPEVFWWTHVTFVETIVAIADRFGTPLTAEEKDQLAAESVTWWRRYGLSDRPVLDTWAKFEAYLEHMYAEELEHNATTRWALDDDRPPLPAPPQVPQVLWRIVEAPTSRVNRWLGNGLMPEPAREILGLRWRRRDEVALTIFATTVRTVWPLLPGRVRYQPRAWEAIRAAE